MKNFLFLILLTTSLLLFQVIIEGPTWFLLNTWDDILKGEFSIIKDFFVIMFFYLYIKLFYVTLVPYLLTFLLTSYWIIKSKKAKNGYIKIGILHFILMVIPALIFLYYVEEGKYGISPLLVLLFFSSLLAIFTIRIRPFENKIFYDTHNIKLKGLFLNTVGFLSIILGGIGVIFYLIDPEYKIIGVWSQLLIIVGLFFLIIWFISILVIQGYKLITK